MLDHPEPIRHLVSALRQMPGIGPRSAERIALWMMQPGHRARSDAVARTIHETLSDIIPCPVCGFLNDRRHPCPVCTDPRRDSALLCLVEQATDIIPLDRTGAYRGHYHALGGKISPLDHIGPDDLRLPPLLHRLRHGNFTEIILALGSDVEGEATAHYFAELLSTEFPTLNLTRLAQGLPAGGALESADDLTLFRALSARVPL